MISARAKSVPWSESRKRVLTKTENALAYLQVTAQQQPEFMLLALEKVLNVRPDLGIIAISRYAHLLKKSDLTQLAATYAEAGKFIAEHEEAFTLLVGA